MSLCPGVIRFCLPLKTIGYSGHMGTQILPPSKHLHPSLHICNIWACLTLSHANRGTQGLYLATTCGRLCNWEHIHEGSSSENQLYETIWSLEEEETAYIADVSRAARANVNSVWIMATLMKTCGKHYCRGPAPCDSPIRCWGSGVTAAVNQHTRFSYRQHIWLLIRPI